MKYAIIKVVNGTFSIHAEGITDINTAIVQFHGVCQTLWNAQDVVSATVEIVDEKLSYVDSYKEFIRHGEEPEEV